MLFHFISIIIIYWSSFGTNICSMCLSRAVHVYRWSASSSKIWQLQHLCLWIPVAVKEDDGVSLVEKRKSRKDPEGIWVSEPAGGEPLFGSWIVSSESTVVNCCQMLSTWIYRKHIFWHFNLKRRFKDCCQEFSEKLTSAAPVRQSFSNDQSWSYSGPSRKFKKSLLEKLHTQVL